MGLRDHLEKLRNKCLFCLGIYDYIPDQQSDSNILNDISDDQDLEAIETLHDDLRHSHAETLSGFDDLSSKNTRLLQFTGSVFAVIAAAATIVDDLSQFVNYYTISGIFILIISVLMLVLLSRTTSVKSGAGRDVFKQVVGANGGDSLNEVSYRLWICKKYTDWIDEAAKRNRTKACRLRIVEVLTIAGLGLLLAGILIEAL